MLHTVRGSPEPVDWGGTDEADPHLDRLSSAVALSTATVVLSGGAALADAPANGCPAGYQLLSVTTLTALGCHVAAQVDSPSSGIQSIGQPGNGDGLVCAVQLGNRLTPFGLPVYNFIDNQLPASYPRKH